MIGIKDWESVLISICHNGLLVWEHDWLTSSILSRVDTSCLWHCLVLENVPDQLRTLVELLLEMVLVLIWHLVVNSW